MLNSLTIICFKLFYFFFLKHEPFDHKINFRLFYLKRLQTFNKFFHAKITNKTTVENNLKMTKMFFDPIV